VRTPTIEQQSLRTPTEPSLGNFYIRGILELALAFASRSKNRMAFRCSVRGPRLEIPAWMSDRSACPERVVADAHVDLAALVALTALLRPTSSNVPLSGAPGLSHD
jgi:hypothetical protein